MVFIWCLRLLLGGYTGGEGSVGPPTCVGGREGGGGGGPAIPILNRKFSDCRIFSPHGIASVYIANRRRARASSSIWRILRFRFLPPEIDLNALLCEHLYR